MIAYAFGIWLFLLRAEDPLPPKADAVFVLAGSDVAPAPGAESRSRRLSRRRSSSPRPTPRSTRPATPSVTGRGRRATSSCAGLRRRSRREAKRACGADSSATNNWSIRDRGLVPLPPLPRAHAPPALHEAGLACVAPTATLVAEGIAIPLEYAKLVRAETFQTRLLSPPSEHGSPRQNPASGAYVGVRPWRIAASRSESMFPPETMQTIGPCRPGRRWRRRLRARPHPRRCSRPLGEQPHRRRGLVERQRERAGHQLRARSHIGGSSAFEPDPSTNEAR